MQKNLLSKTSTHLLPISNLVTIIAHGYRIKFWNNELNLLFWALLILLNIFYPYLIFTKKQKHFVYLTLSTQLALRTIFSYDSVIYITLSLGLISSLLFHAKDKKITSLFLTLLLLILTVIEGIGSTMIINKHKILAENKTMRVALHVVNTGISGGSVDLTIEQKFFGIFAGTKVLIANTNSNSIRDISITDDSKVLLNGVEQTLQN